MKKYTLYARYEGYLDLGEVEEKDVSQAVSEALKRLENIPRPDNFESWITAGAFGPDGDYYYKDLV